MGLIKYKFSDWKLHLGMSSTNKMMRLCENYKSLASKRAGQMVQNPSETKEDVNIFFMKKFLDYVKHGIKQLDLSHLLQKHKLGGADQIISSQI